MKSQIALYFFCAACLLAALSQRPPFIPKRRPLVEPPPPVKARAYVLGEKSNLTYKEIKAHKRLHLMHLFTPSGMHLTALLCLPAWFLRRRRKTFLLILASIFAACLGLGALESFRRMCLVLGVSRIARRFSFATIALGFGLDLLIGFWQRGAFTPSISWSMSLLFMGTIVLQRFESKRSLYMGLLGAQALVGLAFNQAVYPLGLLLSWMMVALFPLFFPFFVVESFLWPGLSASSLFLFAVETLSLGAGPSLPAGLGFFFCVSYFAGLWPFFIRRMGAFALVASLLPYSLPNLPRHYQKAPTFPFPPPKFYQKKTIHTWGVQFFYHNQMVCRSRPYQWGWSTRCRK